MEGLGESIARRRDEGVHGGGIASRRVLGSKSHLVGIHLEWRYVVTSATNFRVFLHGQDGTVYCGRRTDVSMALDQGSEAFDGRAVADPRWGGCGLQDRVED